MTGRGGFCGRGVYFGEKGEVVRRRRKGGWLRK